MELQDLVKDPQQAMMLVLWKNRFDNPELSVQITPADVAEFEACAGYLQVQPVLSVRQPEGRKGHAGAPAAGNRPAIPPMPDEPPRPFVVVAVVDQGGNGFKPIESTEEGAKVRDAADEKRRHRDNARSLADALVAQVQGGTFSNDTILDAAAALRGLA